MREKISTIDSKYIVLAARNIDTDQIIPARFLKTTTRLGLGKSLFADWRYDAEGQPLPDFVLNRPEAAGARILVAGDNFGCGSSREHAPWALQDFGFRAVISTSIADIFRGNALKNGLIPIVVGEEVHRRLLEGAGESLRIDLGPSTLTLPDGESVTFAIDPFARHCLQSGVDALGFLLDKEAQEGVISKYEARFSSEDR